MAAFFLFVDPAYRLEPWGTGSFTVSVDAYRLATLTLPAGEVVSKYEYCFRPAPAVSDQRQVDMSLFLADGEIPSDYEYYFYQ